MSAIPDLRGAGRLVLAVACLPLAMLAVMRAPTYVFWQISVLVTEAGWILAVIALLVLLPGWRGTRTGVVAAMLAAVAGGLALSPVARAFAAARAARTEIASFTKVADSAPFRITTMFVGVRTDRVQPSTHEYARRDGSPLLLDLYQPADSPRAPRPLVIVIHGGAWRSGDRTQLPKLNPYLAGRGFAVASIEYRLAPQHPYPAAIEDVGAAVRWLESNAQALGIDATRIALLGRSAGGHLALLAAYTLHDPAIRGVVSFYGPADLRWGWNHPTNPRVIDSHDALRNFIGGTLAERGDTFDDASPLRHAATAVPTLLVHGARDELVSVEQAERLSAALHADGKPHAYVRLPWATHGCDYVFRGPCGQISTWSAERFLAAVLE